MAKASTKQPRYTVVIQWSEEDNCFVTSFPEWVPYAISHASGATYEEAAKNAREILELLMEAENGVRANLPPEKLFHYPGADVVNLPDEESSVSHSKISTKKSRKSA
jgi:predicted RNase H-like HicB family nuclease